LILIDIKLVILSGLEIFCFQFAVPWAVTPSLSSASSTNWKAPVRPSVGVTKINPPRNILFSLELRVRGGGVNHRVIYFRYPVGSSAGIRADKRFPVIFYFSWITVATPWSHFFSSCYLDQRHAFT